ncbi:PNK3P-domain-containing protein [Pluteus cervinus]|uniref:PNK3P-domain-containing protein n=1 Tax=Pluteus cervinus TaxID=181527 RepID=A0ACD3B461_9AGAR|nr:PNK3P-domain-containing protein [Pluteus cervinus]
MSSPSISSSSKRPRDGQALDTAQQKIPKIHPFFTKSSQPTSSSAFRWVPLGPKHTCLHALNLDPQPSSKVAAFDLDGTLIKSTIGTRGVKDPLQWEWWRSQVPDKLRDLHSQGYSIVIISNQALRPAAIKSWKNKIELFASSLPNLPFRLFAATEKDVYRKPLPGMWYELDRIFREQGVELDKSISLFVGDAAGRRGDFAGTDRKWAINLEIPFHTPEEYFLNLSPVPFTLEGFKVQSLPIPQVSPTSSPILPISPKCEIVVFVGYPCLGKTSFYRQHFQGAGYVHVNQDTLKTREKCVKLARESIEAGKSCVIDNTNRDESTRKFYIDLAKTKGIPVRCFLFEGSIELAWHNDLYRTYLSANGDKRALVPYGGLVSFRDKFEEPATDEGFSEIRRVNWVFRGTPDEERKWSMWLQVDGK